MFKSNIPNNNFQSYFREMLKFQRNQTYRMIIKAIGLDYDDRKGDEVEWPGGGYRIRVNLEDLLPPRLFSRRGPKNTWPCIRRFPRALSPMSAKEATMMDDSKYQSNRTEILFLARPSRAAACSIHILPWRCAAFITLLKLIRARKLRPVFRDPLLPMNEAPSSRP